MLANITFISFKPPISLDLGYEPIIARKCFNNHKVTQDSLHWQLGVTKLPEM